MYIICELQHLTKFALWKNLWHVTLVWFDYEEKTLEVNVCLEEETDWRKLHHHMGA